MRSRNPNVNASNELRFHPLEKKQMRDKDNRKERLAEEVIFLRERVAETEKRDADRGQSKGENHKMNARLNAIIKTGVLKEEGAAMSASMRTSG
jgi:hypothetical protein